MVFGVKMLGKCMSFSTVTSIAKMTKYVNSLERDPLLYRTDSLPDHL